MDKIKELFLVLALTQLVCCGQIGIFNVFTKLDDDLINFPSISQDSVLLLDSRIPILSSQILLLMSSVQKLFIYGGSVPVAHVGVNLRKMVLFKSSTERLIIDPATKYDLQTLIVAYGKLDEVPSNLSALSKLENLGLIGNVIETIQTDQFTGLVNLRKLDLSRNRIMEVYSSLSDPTNLPLLETFAIGDNRLNHLSFHRWNAPALRILQLHNNRLHFVEALSGTFPALEMVSLRENPLNCQWKDRILNEFKEDKVYLYDKEMVTCDNGVEKIEYKKALRKFDLKLDAILEQIQKLQHNLEQKDQSEESEEETDEQDPEIFDELSINHEISYF